MNTAKELVSDWRDTLIEKLPEGRLFRWVALFVVLYLLIAIVFGMYWSVSPGGFDVRKKAADYAAEDGGDVVTGSVTTAALLGVMETLLHKPGGYLHNDRFPPGLWLDNMPNWEYGALVQVRDLSRAMRESFSRSQSQSKEDKDLAEAEPRYHFDSDSWVLPSSESEYGKAQAFTRAYFKRLSDSSNPDAQFYARADNLRYWLSTVNTRLGSLSQRLSASVGQRRLNTDLAGEQGASQSTPAPGEMIVKTPWTEIDDVFFEARGTTWALIHFLKAMEVDFADVLKQKNALVSLQQIIRELEGTQETVWSPVVLNGTGFGLLANHSLVMASYISRANAAIIDLRDLLQQG
ncbi:DUF2333 family protein [Haliea sp. E17]|uniref:DUF2333 family protein n=1 Tax=Haliea sp. E17 TaxID=3401576 RepID=UPI003AAE0ABE